MRPAPNPSRVLSPRIVCLPVALGLWRHGVPRPLAGGRVFVRLFRVYFNVFFKMVKRRRLYHVIIIRSSPPYPCSGGASSLSGWCVESCVLHISWDPISFHVCWCSFRLVSSNLWLSLLAIVAALVRWSFGVLARRLPICLLQKLFYDKLYPAPVMEGR
jgi:hypothetical protein